jgi:hypothetical protein
MNSTSQSSSRRPTTLIDKITQDLENDVITVRSSRAELKHRYRQMVYGGDPWHEFKIALRMHVRAHGCLVLVDEGRNSHVATMNLDGPDVTMGEAATYFEPLIDLHKLLFGPGPTKLSIHRLPAGDYSRDDMVFFDERGEYLWETRIP